MRFLLLLVAAVIAIFAGVAALQLSGPVQPEGSSAQSQAASNVLTVDVLVARQPIPAGTEITAAMVDRQPWPENLVLNGFIVSSSENTVVGKVTRSTFQAREPLIDSKLAAPDDSGFLAAHLPEGMRAVTIATDAISGVAGYVYPGDRVDILFTHNIPAKGAGTGAPAVPGLPAAPVSADTAGYAEVLAANVPVLAINLREGGDGGAGSIGGFIPSPDAMTGLAGGGTNTPSSMTLQVSDVQAGQIRLAERVGNISVSLRSLKDRGNTTPTPPAGLADLTRVALSSVLQPQLQQDEVKVIRGGMSTPAAAAAPGGLGLFTPGAR